MMPVRSRAVCTNCGIADDNSLGIPVREEIGLCDACRRTPGVLAAPPPPPLAPPKAPERSLREHGPRAVLHWSEVAALVSRAKAIMAENPPSPGFRGGGGARWRLLHQLADEYAITTRTVYRYLRYGPPVTVRVGEWTATFAVKEIGEGAPVQLSGWIHDEELPDVALSTLGDQGP